ncbi:hypothetical protein [Parasitella parasitica]|uniref:AN1-type domain-containing protein n=1 Tax=Parasitella parasitica TaxID=35722 RepID=A0A0B7MZ70_9FUNG|nr:hypothetical protein [Parasitella parasitica]
MEDNKLSEAPTPCTAGCGFYGNKIYNNMCSKCFKENEERNKKDLVDTDIIKIEKPVITKELTEELSIQHQQQQQPKYDQSSFLNSNDQILLSLEDGYKINNETQQEKPDNTPNKAIQKNKGRCFSCRSKIPLAKQLTNKCRCEYVFCDTHRFPDKHECNFDHAQKDKDELAKNNPKLHDKPRGGNSFHRIDSL